MVTGNKGKVVEVSLGLGKPITQVELHIDEIQSLDLSHIVKRKAEDAFAILKKPLLTDDAGLFIYEWQGFPGPFVKYIESSGGPRLMLDMAQTLIDRRAYFICAMAYHDGENIHVAEGRLEGRLSIEIQPGGWGFDPIFIPEGYNQTMGYLRDNKVTFISHRNRALDQLKKLFG